MKAFLINKEEEIPINFIKCKQPQMSEHRGRTWDHGHIWVNEEKIKAWLDTSWGEYIYFLYKNLWYKIRMYESNPFINQSYNIDPFDIKGEKIIIK